jgi:hypothetical protein
MAANRKDTVLKLIALARRESNAPPPERRSALEKAEALRRAMKASWERLGVDPDLVERTRSELAGGSALVGAQTEAPEAPRPSRSSGSGRSGLGVGALARSLIVERPDWTYRRIAEEVNARIAGARASEKSVRWYSHQMRKKGVEGTERRKGATGI